MIVNADDFGKSAGINRAILHCFQCGLCSSATIMATGACFDEACAMVHDHRLLDHIGLHVVLDTGMPLSDGIRRCRRLCDREGRFLPRTIRLYLTREEERGIAGEVAAQIEKTRSRGIPITHIDSHHHVHEIWPILPIVLETARDYRIPYVRLAVNCGPLKSIPLRLYRWCVNERIRSSGRAHTRHFASLANCLWRRSQGPCSHAACEVMVHPVMDAVHGVVDVSDPAVPLDVRLPSELRANLLSYTDHRYDRT